jgi:hypothetical protein
MCCTRKLATCCGLRLALGDGGSCGGSLARAALLGALLRIEIAEHVGAPDRSPTPHRQACKIGEISVMSCSMKDQ